jgi:hypothetical protein
VALFLEALGQLQLSHGVVSFSDRAERMKDVSETVRPREREAIVAQLRAGGGTNDFEALHLAQEMLARTASSEKIIIFVSDGVGDGRQRDACAELSRTGKAVVIGIGVGPEARYIAQQYPIGVVVDRVEDLPKALGDVLVREMKKTRAGKR